MSTGRWIMRGRVFQPRAFAGWALAGAEPVLSTPPMHGVALGYRNRTHAQDSRSRMVSSEFRSRTTEGQVWR